MWVPGESPMLCETGNIISRAEKTGEKKNEPKITIFQVFDQNREVIGEMQELQGALNLLQVARGYQVHLGKQHIKKIAHIWAMSKSRPPPPSFHGNQQGIFFG